MTQGSLLPIDASCPVESSRKCNHETHQTHERKTNQQVKRGNHLLLPVVSLSKAVRSESNKVIDSIVAFRKTR